MKNIVIEFFKWLFEGYIEGYPSPANDFGPKMMFILLVAPGIYLILLSFFIMIKNILFSFLSMFS